jgi:hypothetical protein
MDMNLTALSGGASAVFVFGTLGFALLLCLAGATLSFQAVRSANRSREALVAAEAKLAAAGDLAAEVKRLRAEVENAVQQHSEAVANARSLHNEACAGALGRAPDRGAQANALRTAQHALKVGARDDDGGCSHDQHQHKHSPRGGGHDHDDHDADDHDRKKKHSALASLFGRMRGR